MRTEQTTLSRRNLLHISETAALLAEVQ